MLAFNLMSLFRQALLKTSKAPSQGKDVQHTLKTLRYKLFAKAGYITHEGRQDILKLTIAMRSRVDGRLMGSIENIYFSGLI